MWPFKKTKIFQITWAYDSTSKFYFTEVIRATDIAAAWETIHRQRPVSAISLIEWKEIE